MNNVGTFQDHFSETIEEIHNSEVDIMKNLTNELSNQFINKILSLLLEKYYHDESDELSTDNILALVKYLDYDNGNNDLLINALHNGLKILIKYNIGIYYLMPYPTHNEEHPVQYNEELGYYVIDKAGITRRISFNVYSFSLIRFKTTKANLRNVFNYLNNRPVRSKLKTQIIS